MKYYFTPARVVITNNTTNKYWEKRELSFTAGGNVNCTTPMESSLASPQKI